jgi:Glycosyl transferase family 2
MTREWSAAEGISRTNGVTWDILMCSVESRTEMLVPLLEELERQLMPGVGVRVFRDNLETVYSAKCQRLLDSSSAEYVSFVDDDDWVEPDFVETIMEALHERPDYVGFKVLYTVNGVPQMPALHSLRYQGWTNTPSALYRDISHLNPLRRDLAVRSPWVGREDAVCDAQWADGLSRLGCVKTEVWIDRELYHYRYRPDASFSICSQRPVSDHPLRPDAPWVQWIE